EGGVGGVGGRFPLLASAPYSEYVLYPGEMLFIPRWHWHFVMAVDSRSARLFRQQMGGDGNSRRKQEARPEPESTTGAGAEPTTAGAQLEAAATLELEPEAEYSFSVSFWWGRRILRS
ncbi:hypothetical protein B484DRAFT_449968, partial [Ochromonadaceae sp. CCMP2298]